MMVSTQELKSLFQQKYGDPATTGWGPRRRFRFGYFTPDDIYEAILTKLVTPGTKWVDVGCGRDVFPGNARLAKTLADRCERLVGIDVSDNLQENDIVHEKVKIAIEDYHPETPFDLITLRMVAEHIAQPQKAATALRRIAKSGGKVVIFTVNKFSPVSLISAVVPFWAHHPLKSALWRSEEKDTFPTEYRMNTRRQLRTLFEEAGFREHQFERVDDCRTFARFKLLNWLELSIWTLCRSVSMPYPENCLIGVYERIPEAS